MASIQPRTSPVKFVRSSNCLLHRAGGPPRHRGGALQALSSSTLGKEEHCVGKLRNLLLLLLLLFTSSMYMIRGRRYSRQGPLPIWKTRIAPRLFPTSRLMGFDPGRHPPHGTLDVVRQNGAVDTCIQKEFRFVFLEILAAQKKKFETLRELKTERAFSRKQLGVERKQRRTRLEG